jgi:hypothetical protein
MVPSALSFHCCASWPLQLAITTGAPRAVPLACTQTVSLKTRSSPAAVKENFWFAPPLQP